MFNAILSEVEPILSMEEAVFVVSLKQEMPLPYTINISFAEDHYMSHNL